jgi:hypothetical protein
MLAACEVCFLSLTNGKNVFAKQTCLKAYLPAGSAWLDADCAVLRLNY